jgi:hypothetical protein
MHHCVNGLLLKMKMRSQADRGAARATGLRQILCAGLVCATVLLAAGCGKQAQSPTPPPPDTNASQPAPATPATAVNATPAPAVTTTNAGPDLRELNGELVSWIIQNHRRPASVEDFAASSGIHIPPPPPGKKYALNGRGLIILVNAN